MKTDGSDVKETQQLSMKISRIGDRRFRVLVTDTEAEAIDGTVDVLGDGVLGVSTATDGGLEMRLYADRSKGTVYGWYQTARHVQNDDRNVFWFHRK